MQYDIAGNHTQLVDPSAGTINYTFDGFGQLLTQQNARSQNTTITYNPNGTIRQKGTPEGTTKYRYNSNKQLSNVNAYGNISHTYTYDTKGRVISVIDSIPGTSTLTTSFTYDGLGRKSTVTSPSGITETNNYNSYGYLYSITSRNATRWAITGMNSRGQVTSGQYGGSISAGFGIDNYGFLTSITAGSGNSLQNFSYNYNSVTGNLSLRQNNNGTDLKETFNYDNLDRLDNVYKGVSNPVMSLDIAYDGTKGGITTKTDVGTLLYNVSGKPYALGCVNPSTGVIPAVLDSVIYTSFESVNTISEGNYSATFVYNPENERAKMEIKHNGSTILTRWYLGSDYIKETQGGVTKEYSFIGGNAYTAFCVAVKQQGVPIRFYYLLRDHLGSITGVTDSTGILLYQYSYDSWGRMRNTTSWINFSPGSEPSLFVAGRGYTGHENLLWFSTINMNGRLYDPLTGQFLNPDNNVQAPDFTQNLNRYIYCVNNPLTYNDQDGEFFWFPVIALAVIFGGYNTAIHAQQGDIHNFWDGLGYFAQGAAAGAAAGAGWAFGIAGITSTSTLAQIGGWTLINGKAVNAISTTTSFINNPENSLKLMMGKAYTDKNRSFLGGIWQGISRFTWEGLQTWSGYNYTQLRNTIGKVDEVRYFGGATFAIDENVARFNGWRGVSLGNYINAKIPGNLDEDYPSGWIYSEGGLFWHEYGHTFDSQLYGLSYLLSIGLPSARDAEWTERRANNWAWKYAKKYKYMDEWMYPDKFPLK